MRQRVMRRGSYVVAVFKCGLGGCLFLLCDVYCVICCCIRWRILQMVMNKLKE